MNWKMIVRLSILVSGKRRERASWSRNFIGESSESSRAVKSDCFPMFNEHCSSKGWISILLRSRSCVSHTVWVSLEWSEKSGTQILWVRVASNKIESLPLRKRPDEYQANFFAISSTIFHLPASTFEDVEESGEEARSLIAVSSLKMIAIMARIAIEDLWKQFFITHMKSFIFLKRRAIPSWTAQMLHRCSTVIHHVESTTFTGF